MALSTVVAMFWFLIPATELSRSDVGPALKGWVQVSEPHPSGEEFRCGAWTPWRAEFTQRGKGVAAGLTGAGVAEMRPPFPVNGVTTHPRIRSFAVSDGWLVSVDDGEFGAAFRWFSEDGSEQRLLAETRIVAFVPPLDDEQPEAIWLLEGFAHLTKSEGAISLIRRASGGWRREVVAKLPGKPHAFARASSGAIVIAHDKGVVRFTRQRQLESVTNVDLYGLEPSSVRVTPSQGVFVGMRRFVLHIRTDGSRGWYVPAGCERFTAVDPLESGGADCVCKGWPERPRGK